MKRVVLGSRDRTSAGSTTVSSPPAIFHFASLENVRDVAHEIVPPRLASMPDRVAAKECVVAEIFGSGGSIPTLDGDTAALLEDFNVESPPGGFKYRITSYGSNVETGMHATHTFDIDTVISGEMTIIGEDGTETELTAGDTIVIPGVVHSWRSGPNGCRVAFFMIGMA